MEKLDNGEFSKVEKADDFLVAIPKNQPEPEKTVTTPTMDNPFGIPQTKAPTLRYKVLTPAYDPELMKRLDNSGSEVQVTRETDPSKALGGA